MNSPLLWKLQGSRFAPLNGTKAGAASIVGLGRMRGEEGRVSLDSIFRCVFADLLRNVLEELGGSLCSRDWIIMSKLLSDTREINL